MEIKKLCILFLLLIISMGAVAAAEETSDTIESSDAPEVTQNSEISHTFKNLTDKIETAPDSFNVQHDYTFNNETDEGYVVIAKDNYVINGNNHIIDGNKQSGIFNITGNNVTINDLVFKSGKSAIGGIIASTGEITLNNVTFILNNVSFISDHTKYLGGAIANYGGKINCYNSRFIDNHAESGAAIFIEHGELNVRNTNITSSIPNRYGQIWARYSTVNIDSLNVINVSAIYSPAVSLEYCDNTIITNSRFINLTADFSAGAISQKRQGNLYIRNCEFINTTSFKNAGAIIADYIDEDSEVTILDSLFYNSSSLVGGTYVQLGGSLFMNNTSFINNRVTHNGGAVYISFTQSEIFNCTFDSNCAEGMEDYPSFGGAIYSDFNSVEINGCRFINNSASLGNAIFAYDSDYIIANNIFRDNKNAICTFYDGMDELNNNTYNNDSVIINQTLEYEKYVDTEGMTFDLINNTIDVANIPSKFDLRDWGWVSSIKHQGHMGACWTFGTIGTLESAILKTYGIELDLSESNLFHNLLRYSMYGSTPTSEGGGCLIGSAYMISWYGPILEEYDVYDEVGKLLPYSASADYDIIHIQDVMFIPYNLENNNSEIKLAIMKYGAVGGGYHAEYGDEGFYDSTRASQYTNESLGSNHAISIVGWDDNYSKDNFLITPPGDGAWIIKNSWGSQFGDNGFLYLSYYDKTFLSETDIDDFAMAILIENTIPYNKNYQHTYTWAGEFFNGLESFTCKNIFNAADDDLLAGVGTYFETGGENYTVEIYVNDELKLVQDGISPYCGYHTIKLNEYIPIKKGDVFSVVLTASAVPYISSQYTRVHNLENTSFVYYDGEWADMASNGMTACIKAYTVNDDSKLIENSDISIDYVEESYFTVKVVTSDGHAVVGAPVEFRINGKTTNVATDAEGVAKVEIAEVPGNYVVTTVYNNQTYENNITVKMDLQNCKVIAEDIAVDYAGGSYFTVKVVSGDGKAAVFDEPVMFIFNGDVITVKTDKDGMAKIEITQTPGEYPIQTVFNGKTYSNKVTVKHVLTSSKVTVKKTAKKFALKATLKINGKLQKGKTVTFKLNGKTYKAKTDAKGIAKVTVKKNVIKKLKKGKTYTVKVTYLKDTIKSSVKVR